MPRTFSQTLLEWQISRFILESSLKSRFYLFIYVLHTWSLNQHWHSVFISDIILRGFSFLSKIQSSCCLFLPKLSDSFDQFAQNWFFWALVPKLSKLSIHLLERSKEKWHINYQLIEKKLCQNSLEYGIVFSQSPQSHSKYPESQESQIPDGPQSDFHRRCQFINMAKPLHKAKIVTALVKRSFNPQKVSPWARANKQD